MDTQGPSLVGIIASIPSRAASIYTSKPDGTSVHTFSDLHRGVTEAMGRLRAWGVTPHMRVGIYAPSSYEWLLYDLALIELGAISVPFTDDFSGQLNQALLDRYSIALLLTTRSNAHLLPDRPAHIALIDSDNGAIKALERSTSRDADEDDQLSLVFSSGSAGGLKGLVISRSGVAATLGSIIEALELSAKDRILLFLPMSNFQQRFACYAALRSGSDIILTDYKMVFEALSKLGPTIFLAPPIFYQMVHNEFRNHVPVSSWQWRMARVASFLPSGIGAVVLRRLFPQFYRQFGSRMRTLMTGMAPLRKEISEFFAMMRIPLTETYGMVEAGVMALRPGSSTDFETVGKPLSDVRFEIGEDGEVFVHRPKFVALRYFQCAPGENELTFPGAGRIATGDIGRLNAKGWLSLVGRKKEVITTAGGSKIHPEAVEKEVLAYPGVTHAVLTMRQADGRFIWIIDLAAPHDRETEAAVIRMASGLRSLRSIAPFVEVRLASEPFSTQNGMLRPNMKIDRRAVAARYAG